MFMNQFQDKSSETKNPNTCMQVLLFLRNLNQLEKRTVCLCCEICETMANRIHYRFQ